MTSVSNQAKQSTAGDGQAKQTTVTVVGNYKDILLAGEDGARLMTEDSKFIRISSGNNATADNQAKN